MKHKSAVYKQCLVALGVAVNMIGSFIAIGFRLPVYLDSIGTIFISSLFGAPYGIITGLLSNIINGISFDIYSLYYIPVQVITACMAAFIMRSEWNSGWRMIPGVLAVSLPASVAGAVITAFVFGGITSSGSSYLVTLMHGLGMNLTLSCFLVQAGTDYLDKIISVILVKTVSQRVIGKERI